MDWLWNDYARCRYISLGRAFIRPICPQSHLPSAKVCSRLRTTTVCSRVLAYFLIRLAYQPIHICYNAPNRTVLSAPIAWSDHCIGRTYQVYPLWTIVSTRTKDKTVKIYRLAIRRSFGTASIKKTQAVGLDNSSTNVTLQIRRQYLGLLCTDVCESVILLVNTANEKTKGSRVVTNSWTI